MAVKYSKLKGRIVEKYGTQSAFAVVLGKTTQTVSAKLNGKTPFSVSDIHEWAELLEITIDEIGRYFFA